MSEQGDGAPASGTGATGTDAFGGPAEGVDGNALAQPENGNGNGFDRINARMEELSTQQRELVEALQFPGFDYAEEDYGDGYEDGEGYEEGYEQGEGDEQGDGEDIAGQDILDLIDRSVDRRLEGVEAEHAIEDRDEDFNSLRDALPILQNEQTARAIVNRAVDLAEAWDPRIIDGPEMVKLVELVAKASIGDQAVSRERPVQTPGVQLESAQGAAQTTATPIDEDWGARIVAAAQRLRPQI